MTWTVDKRNIDDGTIICTDSNATVVTSGANKAITVTVKDARHIIQILNVRISTSPATTVDSDQGHSWTKNVVGMTLGSVGAGTTVTAYVTVLAM